MVRTGAWCTAVWIERKELVTVRIRVSWKERDIYRWSQLRLERRERTLERPDERGGEEREAVERGGPALAGAERRSRF